MRQYMVDREQLAWAREALEGSLDTPVGEHHVREAFLAAGVTVEPEDTQVWVPLEYVRREGFWQRYCQVTGVRRDAPEDEQIEEGAILILSGTEARAMGLLQ